jgi:hypothetical protein
MVGERKKGETPMYMIDIALSCEGHMEAPKDEQFPELNTYAQKVTHEFYRNDIVDMTPLTQNEVLLHDHTFGLAEKGVKIILSLNLERLERYGYLHKIDQQECQKSCIKEGL